MRNFSVLSHKAIETGWMEISPEMKSARVIVDSRTFYLLSHFRSDRVAISADKSSIREYLQLSILTNSPQVSRKPEPHPSLLLTESEASTQWWQIIVVPRLSVYLDTLPRFIFFCIRVMILWQGWVQCNLTRLCVRISNQYIYFQIREPLGNNRKGLVRIEFRAQEFVSTMNHKRLSTWT